MYKRNNEENIQSPVMRSGYLLMYAGQRKHDPDDIRPDLRQAYCMRCRKLWNVSKKQKTAPYFCPLCDKGKGECSDRGENGNTINVEKIKDWGGQDVMMIYNLVTGITTHLPELIRTAGGMITSFLQTITAVLPEIIQRGMEWIIAIATGFLQGIPEMLRSLNNVLQNVFTVFLESLPGILEVGVNMIVNLVTGIMSKIPDLITGIGEIIRTIMTALLNAMPEILKKGGELIYNLVTGIANHLPDIAEAAGKVIGKLLRTIADHLPEILETGIKVIGHIVTGMIRAIPKIVESIPKLVKAIKDGFGDVDWGNVGKAIIKGIIKGLLGAAQEIWDACGEVAGMLMDGLKSALGINSPAKKGVWIGEMLDRGLAEGAIKNKWMISDAMDEIADVATLDTDLAVSSSLPKQFKSTVPFSGQTTIGDINVTVYGAEGQDVRQLADEIEQRINANVLRRKAAYA